jgi:hypothetical protein
MPGKSVLAPSEYLRSFGENSDEIPTIPTALLAIDQVPTSRPTLAATFPFVVLNKAVLVKQLCDDYGGAILLYVAIVILRPLDPKSGCRMLISVTTGDAIRGSYARFILGFSGLLLR